MTDPMEDVLDVGFDTRLCPTCARRLSVFDAGTSELVLALHCPVHGRVGAVPVRELLGEVSDRADTIRE